MRTELFINAVGKLCTQPDLQQQPDVQKSMHHDIITKATNNMQLCRLIYYSLSALHVSGDIFAHHQEHLNIFTASGSIHQCRCRLVS